MLFVPFFSLSSLLFFPIFSCLLLLLLVCFPLSRTFLFSVPHWFAYGGVFDFWEREIETERGRHRAWGRRRQSNRWGRRSRSKNRIISSSLSSSQFCFLISSCSVPSVSPFLGFLFLALFVSLVSLVFIYYFSWPPSTSSIVIVLLCLLFFNLFLLFILFLLLLLMLVRTIKVLIFLLLHSHFLWQFLLLLIFRLLFGILLKPILILSGGFGINLAKKTSILYLFLNILHLTKKWKYVIWRWQHNPDNSSSKKNNSIFTIALMMLSHYFDWAGTQKELCAKLTNYTFCCSRVPVLASPD